MAAVEGVPEVWSDLHPTLQVDAQGAIRKVVNVAAVKVSIDNILRTRKGERVMLRGFGAGIQDLVFEATTSDMYDDAVAIVKDEIEIWDSRVIVRAVSFTRDPDRNAVNLKMVFGIRGYEDIFEHTTSFIGE